MLFLKYILLITPILFWYFFGFIVNDIRLELDNKNNIFVLASILSGVSIYLTYSKYGADRKVMLLFLLALVCESAYSYYTKRYIVNDRSQKVNREIFIIIMLMFFINSVRIYKQINAKIYLGALCLITHVLIILIKFIS